MGLSVDFCGVERAESQRESTKKGENKDGENRFHVRKELEGRISRT